MSIIASTQMRKMWRNAFANYTSSTTTNGEYNELYNWGGIIKIYSGTINNTSASTLLLSVDESITTVETVSGQERIIYHGQGDAIASGNASWFSLSTTALPSEGWTNNIRPPWAYGTVGTDSGADLMIGNTAIVSGTTYLVNNLTFTFAYGI